MREECSGESNQATINSQMENGATKRRKWTLLINKAVMRSYFLCPKLETDMTVHQQKMLEAFEEIRLTWQVPACHSEKILDELQNAMIRGTNRIIRNISDLAAARSVGYLMTIP